ncbi:MAG TPA: DUF3108 domain-containing protein [Ignavibacteriaceae bacterium]|nr:DUF3108 domain-containing protein [Ignavibacteriaceae bacterium]
MKISILVLLGSLLISFLFIGSRYEPIKENKKVVYSTFTSERKLEVGEDLTYLVRYGFIKLGEIRLKVLAKKTENNKDYYKTIAYIDSYSGVPLVDLHQIYESSVSYDYYSDFFRGIVRYEDYSTFTTYKFDYNNRKIYVKKGKIKPYELWTDSTTSIDKRYQDGLSIFYFARMEFNGEKKYVKAPCYVNEEKVNTSINWYNKVEKQSIDAVDYDIACLKLDGYTDFKSIFGLTGHFDGWFSNDEASIPIIAHMKVLIGDITVELKSWKRNGWNPPIYKE